MGFPFQSTRVHWSLLQMWWKHAADARRSFVATCMLRCQMDGAQCGDLEGSRRQQFCSLPEPCRSFNKVLPKSSQVVLVKKQQQIENRQLFHLHLARQILNSSDSDLPLQETKKDLVFDVLAWRGMTGMISEGQLMDLMDKQQGRVPPNGWRDPAQALETQQIPGLNLCSLTAFGQLMQWSSF